MSLKPNLHMYTGVARQWASNGTMGAPIGGAKIRVYQQDLGNLPSLIGPSNPKPATIYLNRDDPSPYSYNGNLQPLTADAEGTFFFFAAPGAYTLKFGNSNWGDSEIAASVPTTFVDVSLAPYYAPTGADDATSAIAQAISDVDSLGGGTVFLPQVFNVTNLVVPDTVSLQGTSLSDSGLKQLAFTTQNPTVPITGPVLTLTSTTGRPSSLRRKQYLKFMIVDGNNVGVNKFPGSLVTNATNQIKVNQGALSIDAAPKVGHLIEGVGIPPNTTISAVSYVTSPTPYWLTTLSATTIQGNGATLGNTTTGADKVITREAFTAPCTATNNSNTLTSAGDLTANIRPGMRMFTSTALILPVDADNTCWVRVAAVAFSAGVTSITMDQAALGTTPAQSWTSITFYVKNDGILVAEPIRNPNDPTAAYAAVDIEEVQTTGAGGNGFVARTGRDQIQYKFSKVSSCYGRGISMTRNSDCYLERVNSGSNWEENIYWERMATVRWRGEAYQTYLRDRCYDIWANKCREFSLSDSDINGRVKITGGGIGPWDPNTDADQMPIVTLTNVNFKFTAANLNPDPAFPTDCYIVADGTYVQVIGGGFKPDRNDPTGYARPQYIVNGFQPRSSRDHRDNTGPMTGPKFGVRTMWKGQMPRNILSRTSSTMRPGDSLSVKALGCQKSILQGAVAAVV